MNIALFSDTFLPSINGVASSIFTLLTELRKLGHRVYVVTTVESNTTDSKLKFEDDILRIPGILLKKLYNYRAAFLFSNRAVGLIKQMHLDIIHIHTEMGIGMFGKIVAQTYKIPLVYTYHTMYEDYTHYVTKRIKYFSKGFIARLTNYYANTTDEIISPSIKTKNALRRYNIQKFINVIPTGIDIQKYEYDRMDPSKIESLRKKYDLENKFVIISLGRIAKEKAIDLVIDGFASYLKEAKKEVVLLIVGDGPDKVNLESQVHYLNISKNVIFTGFVKMDEVQYYYRLADAFISASISETQGLTYIEAMASDLIVLARYDKNLESIIENNKNGYFFTDKYSLVDKINKILTLDKETITNMKEEALSIALTFSATKFGKNVEHVYNRARRAVW